MRSFKNNCSPFCSGYNKKRSRLGPALLSLTLHGPLAGKKERVGAVFRRTGWWNGKRDFGAVMNPIQAKLTSPNIIYQKSYKQQSRLQRVVPIFATIKTAPSGQLIKPLLFVKVIHSIPPPILGTLRLESFVSRAILHFFGPVFGFIPLRTYKRKGMAWVNENVGC